MPPIQPISIARHALMAAVFNTVLALALTLSGHEAFGVNLLYSQLIGMLIWALIDGGRLVLFAGGWTTAPAMAGLVLVSVLIGYFGGSAAGDLLRGYPPLHGLSRFPKAMIGFLLLSLAAGSFGTYYLTSRALLASARLAHEEALRQATEARLKLLESQLEPHMLFNTLANLRALIGIDPARAQLMVDHLNRYLRATLSGARTSTHPLAAEFARLEDYLELMAIRMGPRLHFTLDLPADLREVPVPPLLLQPLVENAIRHGLEPCIAGGHITVRARREADTLVLEVADTGQGLEADAPALSAAAGGFGLTQVRERLATAFGPEATLELRAEEDQGTRGTIRFPLKSCNYSGPRYDSLPLWERAGVRASPAPKARPVARLAALTLTLSQRERGSNRNAT